MGPGDSSSFAIDDCFNNIIQVVAEEGGGSDIVDANDITQCSSCVGRGSTKMEHVTTGRLVWHLVRFYFYWKRLPPL
jgi:hypothetical protein